MPITTRAELAAVIASYIDFARTHCDPNKPVPASAGEKLIRLMEDGGLRIIEYPPSDRTVFEAMRAVAERGLR